MSEPEQAERPPPQSGSAKDPLRRSRASIAWMAVVALAILLLFLIIFIAQNTRDVQVSFLGWDGEAPLAVSLLIASLVGIVAAVIAGSLRIVQLRRRVRRVQNEAGAGRPDQHDAVGRADGPGGRGGSAPGGSASGGSTRPGG